ncbi:MAG: diaminopimelate epimerase [Sciscionella sp.]
MAGVRFVKGHGTQNDFVLLPDELGELELTDNRVRALCDRRSGLGADGVLRVVRSGAMPAGTAGRTDTAEWFMDYRNADGSLAEMCGNGVRVFAAYLVSVGLAEGGQFSVGTRAGDRAVTVHRDTSVTVAMGPARIGVQSTALLGGTEFPGILVDVGNPHLVCVTERPIDELDLREAPGYDPVLFPHGVNIEFVTLLAEDKIRMRVFERGVGETRSCGTGTVAAAVVALSRRSNCVAAEGCATVEIPGGLVTVHAGAHGTTLRGPAQLVAEGELTTRWWEAQR